MGGIGSGNVSLSISKPPLSGLQTECTPAPDNLLQFLFPGSREQFGFYIDAAAQNIAKFGNSISGPIGIFVYQGTNTV